MLQSSPHQLASWNANSKALCGGAFHTHLMSVVGPCPFGADGLLPFHRAVADTVQQSEVHGIQRDIAPDRICGEERMCCKRLSCTRLRLFTGIIVLTLVLILTDSLVLQIRTLRCKNVSGLNLAWEN